MLKGFVQRLPFIEVHVHVHVIVHVRGDLFNSNLRVRVDVNRGCSYPCQQCTVHTDIVPVHLEHFVFMCVC